MKKIHTNFFLYIFSSKMVAWTLVFHFLFLSAIFTYWMNGPDSYEFDGAPAVLMSLTLLLLIAYYIHAVMTYKNQKL